MLLFDITMKRRLIPPLATEALASMPTKQLLGRLRCLQRCEDSPAFSDRTPEEIAASESILFKGTAEWQRAYADLKAVLATRKHVPSAAERAQTRQQRATRKSNKRGAGKGGIPSVLHTGRARPALPDQERSP